MNTGYEPVLKFEFLCNALQLIHTCIYYRLFFMPCFALFQFEQIAEGLGKAKVVLAFVSKQYANSENCRIELQFALKVHKNFFLGLLKDFVLKAIVNGIWLFFLVSEETLGPSDRGRRQ